MRAADDVPGLVVAEVETRDPAGERGSSLLLLADDEALVPGLCDEEQPVAARAPAHRPDAMLERRELERLAAGEWEEPDLGNRVVIADRRPQVGDALPVGRDRRRPIPDPATGELLRAPSTPRPRPQVRDVVVAAGASQDVDDRRPVGVEGRTTRARPGRVRALGDEASVISAGVCTESVAARE